MGKISGKIKEGATVVCGNETWKIKRVIMNPELKKPEFFTLSIGDKEVMLPIESIHKITGEAIYVDARPEQITNLPDINGKGVCNERGYVYMDLRAIVYKVFNLPRPYVEYY